MSSAITVRKLDDHVKEQLRIRAARHGRSAEAEVRAILADAVNSRLVIVVDTSVVSELMRPSPSPLVRHWVGSRRVVVCATADQKP